MLADIIIPKINIGLLPFVFFSLLQDGSRLYDGLSCKVYYLVNVTMETNNERNIAVNILLLSEAWWVRYLSI